MATIYKVSGSYIEASKEGNRITEKDSTGFTQSYVFNGTVKEFMNDTYNTYEVAAIAQLPIIQQ